MAGMLQIITYLGVVYLVVKGIEILQIALASSRPEKERSTLVAWGVIVLVACIIAGMLIIRAQDEQAASLSSIMGR